MSSFANLARNLGEKKFVYKGLSIGQLVTTTFILIFSIIVDVYYFTQVSPSPTNQDSYDILRYLLIASPIIFLFGVITSIFWILLNFKKEPARWMAVTSIFGTVFVAVLGLAGIIVSSVLWFMTGHSALVVVAFLVVCLCEVYWVIAVIGCLANIRWLEILGEETSGVGVNDDDDGMDQDGREQLIDEE